MKPKLFFATIILLLLSLSAFAQDAPPKEEGNFRKPDLVELIKLDSTFKLDIRYATNSNFVGRPVYTEARAFLQRPAAEALVRVNKKLKEKGYGLMIFDGYRPWNVTKLFWDITPEDKKKFVADPAKGSRHNRGCAVDLTLYDLKTGMEVTMTGYYDEFSERSHPDYKGGTEQQRAARDLLRKMMESEGFTVYEEEWWHFDYKDWREYPILNLKFSEIAKQGEPETVRDWNIEYSLALLDKIVLDAQQTGERIFIVAHLGKKETQKRINQTRLDRIQKYFVSQRGVNPKDVVTAEGKPSKEESYLDFYLGSKLCLVVFFRKSAIAVSL
jgi:D-alanyl-D-alanine dipeptidase